MLSEPPLLESLASVKSCLRQTHLTLYNHPDSGSNLISLQVAAIGRQDLVLGKLMIQRPWLWLKS